MELKCNRTTKLEPLEYEDLTPNEDGYFDEVPRGWIVTDAPSASLRRTKIQHVVVKASWDSYERAYHPRDKRRIRQRERSGTIIPKIEEIRINGYGNSEGIPYRWVTTKLTKPQLNKIGVKYVNALIGWTRYGPEIAKYIHPKDQKAVENYTPIGRSNSKRRIEIYAVFMTDDESKQEEIIDEYDHNKSNRGTAWKLLSQGYADQNIDAMWDAFRMMRGARIRHQHTDYDLLLRKGYSRDEARQLMQRY